MNTIEINSIAGTLKSIEIRIDNGIPKVYPASFNARSDGNGGLVIKSEMPVTSAFHVDEVGKLTVNGAVFTTAEDAVVAINELANFNSGGGTSANNPAEWGQIQGTLSNQSDLNSALNGKVDKITGKGLSTNDYTTAEKNKLAGIDTYVTEGLIISQGETAVGIRENLRDATSGLTAESYAYFINAASPTQAGVMTKNDKVKLDSLTFEKNGVWYLDSVNGDDANDGRTSATAKKTFKSLLDYLEGVMFNPKTPADANKTAIEVYLADGTYELQYFQYDRPQTTGMIIYGNAGDNKLVNLSLVDIRHIPLLMINDVTVFKSTSNTNYIGIFSSTVYFINCRLQHNIASYNSSIDIQGSTTFSAISGVSKGYGAFRSTNSYIYFHPSGIFIEDSNLTKSMFLLHGGAFEAALNGVLTDGNAGLYTGKFIDGNYGCVIRFFDGHIKQILPNCILNMNELNTDPSDTSKMNLFSKIIQEHNLSTKRDAPDCHPISAITGLRAELSLAVPEVPENEFIQTNKTNGSFGAVGYGINNSTYFCSLDNTGIWRLDDDGAIRQTNKIDNDFHTATFGANLKTYFGSGSDTGIWYLDDDGLIKQSNKTNGSFHTSGRGQDDKTYFGSNNNEGIWRLDSDGQIRQTNITGGFFVVLNIANDSKLYFSSGDNAGIYYLDNDGLIKQTNQTTGYFTAAGIGQDGKMYISSGGSDGVVYLDNDGLIKPTNITTGFIQPLTTGDDSKLYFGARDDSGIWYLDDDGLIKQTNKTDGNFLTHAIDWNRILYFCSDDDTGVWYLDYSDGLIKQTGKTDGNFMTVGVGNNNTLYFGSNDNNGIWHLEDNTYLRKRGYWEKVDVNNLNYIKSIKPASNKVIISGDTYNPEIDIDIAGDVVEFFTSTETPTGSIGSTYNGLQANLTEISTSAALNVNDVIYYANNMRGVVSSVPNASSYTVVLTAAAQLPSWGQIQGAISNQTDLQAALDDKVDNVPGKGLSANDYTNAEKTKLSRINTHLTNIVSTELRPSDVRLTFGTRDPAVLLSSTDMITIPGATQTEAGVMTKDDKAALDALSNAALNPMSHNALVGRDASDCHPFNSITGLLEWTEQLGPQVEDILGKYAEAVYGVDIDMTADAGKFILMNIVIDDIHGQNTGEYNVCWIDANSAYNMVEEVRPLSSVSVITFGLYDSNKLRIAFVHAASRHLTVKTRAYCKDTANGITRPSNYINMYWLLGITIPPANYVDIPITSRAPAVARTPLLGSQFQEFVENSHGATSTTFFPANGNINFEASRSGDWVTIDRYCFMEVTRISPGPNIGFYKHIEVNRVGAGTIIAAGNQNMQNNSWSDTGGHTMLLRPGDRIRLTVYNYNGGAGTSQPYTKNQAWTNVKLRNIIWENIPT